MVETTQKFLWTNDKLDILGVTIVDNIDDTLEVNYIGIIDRIRKKIGATGDLACWVG